MESCHGLDDVQVSRKRHRFALVGAVLICAAAPAPADAQSVGQAVESTTGSVAPAAAAATQPVAQTAGAASGAAAQSNRAAGWARETARHATRQAAASVSETAHRTAARAAASPDTGRATSAVAGAGTTTGETAAPVRTSAASNGAPASNGTAAKPSVSVEQPASPSSARKARPSRHATRSGERRASRHARAGGAIAPAPEPRTSRTDPPRLDATAQHHPLAGAGPDQTGSARDRASAGRAERDAAPPTDRHAPPASNGAAAGAGAGIGVVAPVALLLFSTLIAVPRGRSPLALRSVPWRSIALVSPLERPG